MSRALLTVASVAAVLVIHTAIVTIAKSRRARTPGRPRRIAFWIRQGSSLAALVAIVIALLAIWFNDSSRLTTITGFATAGVAIAAQRAVTAFAGYLIIMRGRTFTIGDRIKMGGVHGDVISLGFLQTRILEMGQPPVVGEQDPPGMWVGARQYTGRIVTITNDRIFDEPVYNFTRELPFIWEEIAIPIPHHSDRAAAERILLDAARAETTGHLAGSRQARARFEAKFGARLDREDPHVYWRVTDNWLELTVRFVVPDHGIREIKDAMSRRILAEFERAHIDIASTTFGLVELPAVRIVRERARVTHAGSRG
jgi:small-conductance mechanosensitive channel